MYSQLNNNPSYWLIFYQFDISTVNNNFNRLAHIAIIIKAIKHNIIYILQQTLVK